MTVTPEKNHLDNLDAWPESRARQLAEEENIQLTEAHWEVLNVARLFYAEYGFSPSMRPLIKSVGIHLDISKARSIYLMQLFPPSPARVAAKIAGLPKPKNCL